MSEALALRGEHAPGLVGDARAALAAWVRDGGSSGRIFLQVHLSATGDGRFRICNVADRSASDAELRRHSDPYAAREIAQTTAEGEHRPLKTAPNLRCGWLLEGLDERGLWTAMDYLYPACVVHWHAGRVGGLRVTPWIATAGRQSGMYGSVRLLPEAVVRDTVRACCGDAVCLRTMAWGYSGELPTPMATGGLAEGAGTVAESDATVPCPEACSMFVSFARAVLQIERQPRRELPGLGTLNDPEVAQLRSLVSGASGGRIEWPREGEFDHPLNLRRLRYLATRLGPVPDAAPEEDS